MYPDKVAVLMKELERVLDHERPVNDGALLGRGFSMVVMDSKQVAASPAAKKVHNLITQILEHCPGSEGLKKHLSNAAERCFWHKMSTDQILSYLRSPALFDPEKIEQCEMAIWFDARSKVDDTPAGLALAAELLEWQDAFRKRYEPASR